jgi:hypothetical protein
MRALDCGEQRDSTIIRSGRLPFTSALRTISRCSSQFLKRLLRHG